MTSESFSTLSWALTSLLLLGYAAILIPLSALALQVWKEAGTRLGSMRDYSVFWNLVFLPFIIVIALVGGPIFGKIYLLLPVPFLVFAVVSRY